MKKVGLLTFHRPLNYGAVLQAYALQQSIKDNVCDCEIIDYRSSLIEMQYHKCVNTNIGIILNIKKFIGLPKRFKKEKTFSEFMSKAKISNIIYTEKNFSTVSNEYDTIVVGSDQVWNLNITGYDYNYYLKNVSEINKLSYAASMGKECNNDHMLNATLPYIEEFDFLSVRETSFFEKLKEKGMASYVDVDPTLLLSPTNWNQILEKKMIRNFEYILIYTVVEPENLLQEAEKLSRLENLPIILLSKQNKKIENSIFIADCSVEDFLRYIRDAKYIFTTSFHCTIFSMQFGKEFFVETNSKRIYNNRIIDLIRTFGFEDKEISRIDMSSDNKKLDFNSKRKMLADKSISRLKNSILGENYYE